MSKSILNSKYTHFLDQCIEKEHVKLYAQRLINLRTLKIQGAEVLLRIPQPNTFHLSTSEWVTVAQESGLILPLTHLIIKQVCTYLTLHDRIPLSVNVPPALMNEDFCNFLLKTLKNYNVPKHLLSIEITEFDKPENMKALNQAIQSLRKNHIRVMIDDFGCGFSSMNYLVQLEVDAIKIDKIFVHHAPRQQYGRLILKSLIDLAKTLNLQVICEGIETLDQLEIVRELGAHLAQGFLFHKPVDLANLSKPQEIFHPKPLYAPIPYIQTHPH
jgi:EAL domain-containing protein (putative c-di-GMP-specific phosphodiesterase class I)